MGGVQVTRHPAEGIVLDVLRHLHLDPIHLPSGLENHVDLSVCACVCVLRAWVCFSFLFFFISCGEEEEGGWRDGCV